MTQMTVASPDDKNLIIRIQNGDSKAFEMLYNRYADRLYSFLLYQVGKHMADDLFQDVMIKVQRHLLKFNPDGNFRAWLIKIAINKIRDHHRKINRMKKIFRLHTNDGSESEIVHDVSEMEVTDSIDVPQELVNSEISAILTTVIQKLPENQREVVNLHYLMELSFREIAEILDCSINTIAARARYGLKNIKKILGLKLVNELK
jgi:RNA polymerase sigma-70 factor (ECF subfamily)